MQRLIHVVFIGCAACSGSSSSGGDRTTPAAPVSLPADAAVDAARDAGPSQQLAASPAVIFRYTSAQRTETWTLRFGFGEAMLDVTSATGTVRYLGTATDGETIALRLATSTAKLALDCKRTNRAVGTKCNDAKAKKLDVFDCYHADFKEPMPFGPEPGIEYADAADCKGYRLISR